LKEKVRNGNVFCYVFHPWGGTGQGRLEMTWVTAWRTQLENLGERWQRWRFDILVDPPLSPLFCFCERLHKFQTPPYWPRTLIHFRNTSNTGFRLWVTTKEIDESSLGSRECERTESDCAETRCKKDFQQISSNFHQNKDNLRFLKTFHRRGMSRNPSLENREKPDFSLFKAAVFVSASLWINHNFN